MVPFRKRHSGHFSSSNYCWQPFQVQSADQIEIATGKTDALHAEAAPDLRCASEASEARELTYIHRFAWMRSLQARNEKCMQRYSRAEKRAPLSRCLVWVVDLSLVNCTMTEYSVAQSSSCRLNQNTVASSSMSCLSMDRRNLVSIQRLGIIVVNGTSMDAGRMCTCV